MNINHEKVIEIYAEQLKVAQHNVILLSALLEEAENKIKELEDKKEV